MPKNNQENPSINDDENVRRELDAQLQRAKEKWEAAERKRNEGKVKKGTPVPPLKNAEPVIAFEEEGLSQKELEESYDKKYHDEFLKPLQGENAAKEKELNEKKRIAKEKKDKDALQKVLAEAYASDQEMSKKSQESYDAMYEDQFGPGKDLKKGLKEFEKGLDEFYPQNRHDPELVKKSREEIGKQFETMVGDEPAPE